MTIRNLIDEYMKARDLVVLKGDACADLLMIPVLTDSMYQIAKTKFKGIPRTPLERKYLNGIIAESSRIMHREYWSMDIVIVDTLNDYINKIQDRMDWHSLGFYRAMVNRLDYHPDEKRRDAMAWCLVIKAMSDLTLIARRRMFVKTNNEVVNCDNAVNEKIIEGIGYKAMRLSEQLDIKGYHVDMNDRQVTRDSLHDLVDFLSRFVKEDLDKEI